jgi:hypothetical protein
MLAFALVALGVAAGAAEVFAFGSWQGRPSKTFAAAAAFAPASADADPLASVITASKQPRKRNKDRIIGIV